MKLIQLKKTMVRPPGAVHSGADTPYIVRRKLAPSGMKPSSHAHSSSLTPGRVTVVSMPLNWSNTSGGGPGGI